MTRGRRVEHLGEQVGEQALRDSRDVGVCAQPGQYAAQSSRRTRTRRRPGRRVHGRRRCCQARSCGPAPAGERAGRARLVPGGQPQNSGASGRRRRGRHRGRRGSRVPGSAAASSSQAASRASHSMSRSADVECLDDVPPARRPATASRARGWPRSRPAAGTAARGQDRRRRVVHAERAPGPASVPRHLHVRACTSRSRLDPGGPRASWTTAHAPGRPRRRRRAAGPGSTAGRPRARRRSASSRCTATARVAVPCPDATLASGTVPSRSSAPVAGTLRTVRV